MKQEEIDVLKFVDTKLFPVLTKNDEDNAELKKKTYKQLQEQDYTFQHPQQRHYCRDKRNNALSKRNGK